MLLCGHFDRQCWIPFRRSPPCDYHFYRPDKYRKCGHTVNQNNTSNVISSIVSYQACKQLIPHLIVDLPPIGLQFADFSGETRFWYERDVSSVLIQSNLLSCCDIVKIDFVIFIQTWRNGEFECKYIMHTKYGSGTHENYSVGQHLDSWCIR